MESFVKMVGNDSILQIYLDLNLEEEASDSGRRNGDSVGPNLFGQIIEIPNTYFRLRGFSVTRDGVCASNDPTTFR